ncbi:MAG: UDP-N-acetylmuramoyl-L-alanyl-D-glutamate--2,6-diaminopimelate ligase [Rhizobiales bacterium]|nr:UDP-N-acetylmuramoyl-L-alanyl-D-glutamate--2,6-diaminopimelate ligase [Hyphomicrobiales bacterium]
MRLADLPLDDSPLDPRFAGIEIAGVTADSRKVKPDFLFVAIAGAKADGAHFARAAAASGAVAVAAEQRPDGLSANVAFVQVGNARRALALAAAKFFSRQPGTIAAVTGTSGKTSVAAFTRQIWTALGLQAASIGTVGVVSPKTETYGSLTTPDPVELHRTLDQLAGEGVTHLALEASSHGLDQHRLDGVCVAAGAFTNLSRDHLDYHQTLEAYLAAKQRMFSDLVAPNGTAVIDVDDCYAGQVVEAAKKRGLKIMTVGEHGDDIKLVGGAIDGFAQVVSIAHGGTTYQVKLPLVGGFQVQNAAVAAGLAIATGSEPARVFASLEKLTGAKGRLELAGSRNGAPIFIDYAHKPDALAKALAALRPYSSGKLVVVFGAGGDRDSGKRPIMGRIAAENADRVIVTDDNPRSENPAAIRAAILAAAPGATEIADRAEAIRKAIAELKSGDVLLIAGKGHETGQIIGERVVPFSDHEAVAAALQGKGI